MYSDSYPQAEPKKNVTLDDSNSSEVQGHAPPDASPHSSCVVLIGAMGAGKSSVGWYLARNLGLGFIDVDKNIEKRERKDVATVFAEKGEAHFRTVEKAEIARLSDVRSHVIAVGGGGVMDDRNWQILGTLGITVWLNPNPSEISRRLLANEAELAKRPLLAEVLELRTAPERHKALTERLGSLDAQRQARYKEARLTITDAFSTPESTARLIRDLLFKEGLLATEDTRKAFDRWHVM